MNAAEIQSRIEQALRASHVRVVDTTGGGDHFEALVVAPAFEGKSMLEQHRMVYAALGGAMASEIHALALRTMSPAQWERAQQES